MQGIDCQADHAGLLLAPEAQHHPLQRRGGEAPARVGPVVHHTP